MKRRIVIHLSGTPGGCALEFDSLARERGWPGIGYTTLVGSAIPRLSWTGPPVRLYDGRIELGRAPESEAVPVSDADGFAFDEDTLALCLVAEGGESVSRRQAQVAAQVVYGWKREHRIRVESVIGAPLIEQGTIQFDMDEFRSLVAHWERSSLILLRSFRSA